MAGKNEVKPDFARVRRICMRTCMGLALLVLALEMVLYGGLQRQGQVLVSREVYRVQYIVVPALLNLGAIALGELVLRLCKENEQILNAVPVLTATAICTVTATIHRIFPNTLAVFCLPVFMSAIFGSMSLLTVTGVCNLMGMTLPVCVRALRDAAASNPYLVQEAVIGYATLLTAIAMAHALIRLLLIHRAELVGAAQKAEDAHEQAQAINRAKNDFLVGMSHEMRTPLNTVTGMSEMIQRKAKDEEIRGYASDIQHAGNAMLSMLSDVLDISRLEAGRVTIAAHAYELGTLVNDCFNMVTGRSHEKGLTASVVCDPNLPSVLRGDEYHLRQAIVNLLSNAVKYTQTGGVELSVSGERTGDVLQLIVRVKDTGVGIREEDMPKLFELFQRMERDRGVEGSGLGLSIAKQLVERMGGLIEVESTYGTGSTFTIRVPQTIVDDRPIGHTHDAHLDAKEELPRRKAVDAAGARVLVVDDVPINLMVISRLLEETHVQVDTAESGEACIQLVSSQPYDLIFMDHIMPKMDGVETLRRMREMPDSLNEQTPVVMLTANAMAGAREEYLRLGFVDYLAKPVQGQQLERLLAKYLPADKVTFPAREA